MSGVSNQSQDWQDQLLEIGSVLGKRDRDAIGGYVSNRHVRRKERRNPEPNPFEGVVFQAVDVEVDVPVVSSVGNLYDAHHEAGIYPRGIGVEAVSSNEDGQLQVMCSDEKGEEADMSLKSEDPFLPAGRNANQDKSPKGKYSGSRNAAKNDDDHGEEVGLTEEEQEELDRKHKHGERVKKTVAMSILTVATCAIVGGVAVAITGLLGNHKSNIMNL